MAPRSAPRSAPSSAQMTVQWTAPGKAPATAQTRHSRPPESPDPRESEHSLRMDNTKQGCRSRWARWNRLCRTSRAGMRCRRSALRLPERSSRFILELPRVARSPIRSASAFVAAPAVDADKRGLLRGVLAFVASSLDKAVEALEAVRTELALPLTGGAEATRRTDCTVGVAGDGEEALSADGTFRLAGCVLRGEAIGAELALVSSWRRSDATSRAGHAAVLPKGALARPARWAVLAEIWRPKKARRGSVSACGLAALQPLPVLAEERGRQRRGARWLEAAVWGCSTISTGFGGGALGLQGLTYLENLAHRWAEATAHATPTGWCWAGTTDSRWALWRVRCLAPLTAEGSGRRTARATAKSWAAGWAPPKV
eukprot:scaffold1330_cov240-Pinguiococcus_pyrenoidosus.AAC.20